MSSIQQLLDIGKEKLIASGNEYAKYDRKVLLEETLGCNYMYMLTHGEEEVPAEKEERYLSLIERRAEHYPLQYLLGYAHFMDYTFFVNEHVLIPRNDTEILVEYADHVLKQMEQGQQSIRVLDLCCGSGCIGISLKLYHPEIELTLSDVSKDALQVVKKNVEQYQIQAHVNCGDLFEGLAGSYDMIVCNPPYIESEVVDTLMPEVKEYEPVLALDGGEDGLIFYRRIIEQAVKYLPEHGWIFFEIGSDQGKSVSELMQQQGFADVKIERDYAGLDRVVYGQFHN